MKFAGCLTAPHGAYTVLGLALASASALTATMYSAASCRFYVVTFSSETGSFEEYFSNIQAAESGRQPREIFKAGIGFFQWLRPFSSDQEWSDGSCAGYQELMLESISDTPFEMARLFCVLAIVCAWIIFGGALTLLCMEFNRMQIVLVVLCATMGTIFAGLTFLLGKSGLCQDEFLTTECSLDEGGLVMVAGILLWFATAVVGAMFLREMPLDDEDPSVLRSDQKAKLAAEMARQKAEKSKQQRTVSTPDTKGSYEDERSPRYSSTRVSIARTRGGDDESHEVMPARRSRSAAQARAAAISTSRNPSARDTSTRQPSRSARPMPPPPQTNRPRQSAKKEPRDVYIAERLDRIEALAEV